MCVCVCIPGRSHTLSGVRFKSSRFRSCSLPSVFQQVRILEQLIVSYLCTKTKTRHLTMLIQTQPAQSYSTHMVPASHHLVRQTNNNGTAVDMVTYSNLVNGSIFSIPKSWSKESQEDMLLTVYSFIKTFVG